MSVVPRTILPVATGREAVRALGRGLRRLSGLAWAALGAAMLSSAAGVAVPLLLGRIVDVVLVGGGYAGLLPLVALLLVAALITGVLIAVANRLCDQLGLRLAAELREEAMDAALRIDAATLERAGSGDVTSRITEDVELINASVKVTAGVFTALVTVIFTLVGFVALDWRLALAFLSVFVVHAVGLRRFLRRAGPLYAADRAAAGARTQALLNVLHGAPTVRAYGMQARQLRVVEEASTAAIGATLTANRNFFAFTSTMNIAEAVGLSSLVVTGFFLVRADAVTVGAVTAAALLFQRLFGPLGELLFSFNEVQSAGAALTRLVGVARMPVPEVGPARPRPDAADLRATGVRHAYADGPDVLHGIDVEVVAGQSLAVVGESGAGKTTLAAILGGVFPGSGGTVLIGGEPIEALDPVALRQRVGVVTQDVHVFTGTLRDDLTLAAPDVDDRATLAALATVGADRWVAALPDGLDTRVGEGEHKLTAAQAQQVALARIALADPPIVILDEATAEAGSAGARQLEASARAVLQGRTSVVVAHRLSQAQECDQIAVMSGGRIVEHGTHRDLVAAGGLYARLWTAWHS
jgi:ATP-binding cassette, subfamily C, bacterial